MKAADRKLAYSGIIILIVIAAEVAWFLFVGPTDHHPNYAAKCESDCEIPWWFSESFWMVFFTAVLTGSTALLWRETKRLAEGADDQARWEVSRLLPYVQVSEAEFEWPRGRARIKVTIQNSGQMPAKWFQVMYASASVKKGDQWAIPATLKSDLWSTLAGGGSVSAGLHDDGFTANAAINTNSEEERNFLLLGKVRYADIWDNEYETEFAFYTRDARPTIEQNGGGPRKMSRPTGKLASFVQVKKAD